MIEKFYEKRTIYDNGFDFTTYMLCEMEKADLKQCISPVFAGIRITSICNMACTHCFAKAEPCEMPLVQYKKILDILKDQQIYKLTLTGGEPFTNVDFAAMVLYAKEKAFDITIHTNASLLSDEDILMLGVVLDDRDWVQVSMDGYDEETYFKTRGSFDYSQIYQNLSKLIEIGVNVKLNTVVTNRNIDILKEIYIKAQNLGVKKILFSPLFGAVSKDRNIYFPGDSVVYKKMEEIIELYLQNDDLPYIDIDGIAVPWGCQALTFSEKYMGALMCPAGKTSFEIDVNGDVYPCPYMFCEQYRMGNIIKDCFENIWHNLSITPLLKRKWSTEPVCQNCENFDKCGGGCFAMSVYSNLDCDIRCDKIRGRYKYADFR